MATQYATPLTTQSQIQAWLDAGDDVVGSAGSVVNIVPVEGSNQNLGIRVRAGRTFDLNGCTLLYAGVTGQTLATQGCRVIGIRDEAGATIKNGIIRGPDTRLVSGAHVDASNGLVYVDANGITANALLQDLTLYNGPNQAIQLNNVNGATIRRVTTARPLVAPPATGVYLGHYIDFDVTANSRLTQNVTFDSCDLDAFGQECLKLENCNTIRLNNTRFRHYVTLVQDAAAPYSSLTDIEFDDLCTFHSYISLQNLKRRYNGSGYDNLGGGAVKIRGRFVGDDALILGRLTTASIVTADYAGNQNNADTAHFAALTAELCVFEGQNSHVVPVSGSSWITRSSGVKDRVTIYGRRSRSAAYPFGVDPSVVKGNLTTSTANNLTTTVSTSLSAALISAYYLATRGVRMELQSGLWTGANNRGSWCALSQNVPLDFVSEGGPSDPFIIDCEGTTDIGMSLSGSNNAKQRVIDGETRNSLAGTSSRGWLVNHANADVEFYNYKSRNCSCSNGGGGGRTQAYTAVYIGPGCEAISCAATGTSHGGGYLIDASGTNVVTIEGARGNGCTAAGAGGFMRIASAYADHRSSEAVGCSASAGPGGISVSWSVASVTQNFFGFSGRGNVGSSGEANDIGAFIGTAGSKLVTKGLVMGSGGIVLKKTGSGNFDYGELNRGASGTISVASGTNTDLGTNQTSDPLFVGDTTSVVLQSTSPCKAVATPRWTDGTTRPTLGHDGSWFQVTATKTTMGARQ